jgi:hypothetical protein
MSDRPGSFLECALVRTKYAQKTLCWSVGTIYGPRELPGVSTAGSRVDTVLQVISEPTLTVSRVCVVRGSGIWHMEHVGPEWSHGMVYDDTRHIDVAKRRGS